MLTEFTFPLSWEFFRDKELLESVQKRAVAMVTSLPREMTYPEKLAALGLTTLEAWIVRGDMIKTYRVLTGVDPVNYQQFWELAGEEGPQTRPLQGEDRSPQLEARLGATSKLISVSLSVVHTFRQFTLVNEVI